MGRWRTRMSRLVSATGHGSTTAHATISRTDIPIEDSSLSARKADSDTVPEVALRLSPSAPMETKGIKVCGLDFSRPRLTAASSCALILATPAATSSPTTTSSFRRTLGPRPGHHCRPHRSALCYVTSTGRRGDKAGEIAPWTGLG